MWLMGSILSCSVVAAPATPNASVGKLNVSLKPVRNARGEVDAIEVTEVINGTSATDGKALSLDAPAFYPGAMKVADRVTGLKAHDAAGEIAFTVEEDKSQPGGFPYFRHWIAKRAVTYPVTFSYKALVQPTGGPNGPAFGIRPTGGGVSGSGGGFIMIPSNVDIGTSHVHWDLSGLAKGSVGVSSFGVGAFDLAGTPDKLYDGWFLAGPTQHYAPPSNVPFGAYWLGTPPFDMSREMTWAAKAYQYLGEYFGYLQPAPGYRVFVRVLDTPPNGGGTALFHSFMLSMGKGDPKSRNIGVLRETLFHEMTHQWVGQIEGPDGVVAWFEEGLTVHFTTILPFKGGLESADSYRDEINSIAKDYYTSPAKNWSAARIAEVGFTNETIRHTPYMRGAMYFASLDAEIRHASHGKRTLKDFLMPLFEARQKGHGFDQHAWEQAITKELGPQAVSDFRDEVIDGTKTVVPASDAFGPCYRREAVKLQTDKGGAVEGYQWTHVPGVTGDRCSADI